MPGYYLSSSVNQDPKGSSIQALSGVLEPDSLINLPGVLIGARVVGASDQGSYLEPMLGYRKSLSSDRQASLSAVAFGTHGSGSHDGASYSATRVGAEVGADARLTPRSRWAEVHVTVGASLTGLDAKGDYCMEQRGTNAGYGVDCGLGSTMPKTPIHATSSGLYPGANVGVGFDFARHLESAFQGGRLSASVGAGTMPIVFNAVQGNAKTYTTFGLALSLSLGSAAPDDKAN